MSRSSDVEVGEEGKCLNGAVFVHGVVGHGHVAPANGLSLHATERMGFVLGLFLTMLTIENP